MIEELNKEFDTINNNIDVLPKKTKADKDKINEYIDSEINKYTKKLEAVKVEMDNRYNDYLNKYNLDKKEINFDNELDTNLIRAYLKEASCKDKMNISYYYRHLKHFYKDDISKLNSDILKMIEIFKNVNVNLTNEDYKYTEVTSEYLLNLLNNKNNMHEILDKLYWQNPDMVKQIELCFRHLYFKYEKQINKFYETKYLSNSNLNISEYLNTKHNIESYKHNNVSYLTNLILKNEVNIIDVGDSYIENSINNIVLNKNNPDNYNNLIKLKDSLYEYKNILMYQNIIGDFKALYEKKNEYKGIYDKKKADIIKKEKELFKLNKVINKTGFLAKKDVSNEKNKRTTCISELYDLYKELDELEIKDIIFKYVDDNTTYDEILKLASINFNYIYNFNKNNNEETNIDDIIPLIDDIFKFVYADNINIINNIRIKETRNISEILYDRYRLINIKLDLEKLNPDAIDGFIKIIENIIFNYDINKNNISFENLEYMLSYQKIFEK